MIENKKCHQYPVLDQEYSLVYTFHKNAYSKLMLALDKKERLFTIQVYEPKSKDLFNQQIQNYNLVNQNNERMVEIIRTQESAKIVKNEIEQECCYIVYQQVLGDIFQFLLINKDRNNYHIKLKLFFEILECIDSVHKKGFIIQNIDLKVFEFDEQCRLRLLNVQDIEQKTQYNDKINVLQLTLMFLNLVTEQNVIQNLNTSDKLFKFIINKDYDQFFKRMNHLNTIRINKNIQQLFSDGLVQSLITKSLSCELSFVEFQSLYLEILHSQQIDLKNDSIEDYMNSQQSLLKQKIEQNILSESVQKTNNSQNKSQLDQLMCKGFRSIQNNQQSKHELIELKPLISYGSHFQFIFDSDIQSTYSILIKLIQENKQFDIKRNDSKCKLEVQIYEHDMIYKVRMQLFIHHQSNHDDQQQSYQNMKTILQIRADQWDFGLLHTVEEIVHGLTESIQVI